MSVCKKPRLLAPPIMHNEAKPLMNYHLNVYIFASISIYFTAMIILKRRIDKFKHRKLKVVIFEDFKFRAGSYEVKISNQEGFQELDEPKDSE